MNFDCYCDLSRPAPVAAVRRERAAEDVALLKALGLPAAVLTPEGRILAANALIEAMPETFIIRPGDHLVMASRVSDGLFKEALSGPEDGAARAFPVAPLDNRPGMVVHLLPIGRAEAGGDLLMVACAFKLGASGVPAHFLKALFGLTPAEARLANCLATGAELRNAASRCGITVSTARSYLSQIFRKTGTHRQGELVALLCSGVALPQAGGQSPAGCVGAFALSGAASG